MKNAGFKTSVVQLWLTVEFELLTCIWHVLLQELYCGLTIYTSPCGHFACYTIIFLFYLILLFNMQNCGLDQEDCWHRFFTKVSICCFFSTSCSTEITCTGNEK